MIWIIFLISMDTLKINLEQAKQMAIESNPSYRTDVLSHTHSKLGFYKNLGSNILNPTAAISYSEIEYGMFQPTKGYSFDFSLTQPVFDPMQATGLLQSKISANATNSLREESENWLYYQIENYYLSVLKAQKLVELRKKAIERAEENLRLAQKKVELGEVSRLDLLNAEVYLNRAKLEHSTGRKNYGLASRILLSALGILEKCELLLEPVAAIRDWKQAMPLPSLDSLVAIALEERSCIRAEKEALKGSRIGFYGSILSFLPQVSFKWLWRYNTEEFPERFSEIRDGATKSSGWSGSVGINLFTYPFEVWQSKTTVSKSNLALLSKKLLVVKEVKDTWLECAEVDENLKLAKSMLLSAEEGEKLAKTQYELGLISALELFRASTDRLDAEITYTSAMYDYKLVKTKLQYVTGEEEVR
jgi:outer membrane protein TolC